MSGEMRKVGDWAKVGAVIANLGMEMERARSLSLKRWGLKAEGLAKKHMSSQDLGWTALKAATISAKIRKGQSENILIATSDYFQAITSWADKERAYAGVKKQITNAEGEVIADIAAIHEFGYEAGGIPARPLWQPVYEETMKWFLASDSTPIRIFAKNIQKYNV